MSKMLNDQLSTLRLPHSDNEDGSITFFRTSSSGTELKVIFEDYIVHPFEGFTFHEQWNNGIPPCERVMFGKKTKETKGMYYFELVSDSSDKKWSGWCPKKSCKIINL